MSRSNVSSSRSLYISLLLLMLIALLMLALSACGTQPTAPAIAQSAPLPKVDSSLLAKPQGLATYQLPEPPASLPNEAKAAVVLSDVAKEHADEAAYTRWLENVVNGWQAWYADLVKTYGPVSGPQ